MTVELKPCPFCGGSAVWTGRTIGCEECGVCAPDHWSTVAEFFHAWNRRAPQPVTVRPLEWRAYGNQHMSGWQGMGKMGALYYITDTGPDGERNGGWWYGEDWFETEDEAKSVAQQDYESRIRSALIQ